MQRPLLSRADIAELRRQCRLYARPHRGDLILPDSLPAPDRRRLTRRLGFYLSDCGCAPGSLALLSTLGAYTALAGAWPWQLGWADLGLALALAMGMAFAAKTAALAVTLRLLHRDLDRLADSLPD